MRKKITMLLASLLACVGGMKADVTKFYKPGERVATLTAGQKVMFYNTTLVLNNDGGISQDRTGFLVDNGRQNPLKTLFSRKRWVYGLLSL